MNRYVLLLLLASSCLLSSCFSTYQVESAKRTGKNDAHFVLYRKGIIGFAVGTNVYANGQFVGKIGVNRYLSCWMPEGDYLFSVRMAKSDEVFFRVKMAAGRAYSYYFTYNAALRNGYRPSIHKLEDVAVINRRKPPLVNYFD